MRRLVWIASACAAACGPGIPTEIQTDWCAVDSDQTLVNMGCETCLSTLVPIYPDADLTWVATRLAPATTPFVVESVGYFASGRPSGCDAGLAHRVRVWVDTAEAPAPFPSAGLAADLELPAVPNRVLRPVEVELPEPVRVEAGASLFVAIRLAAGSPGGLCLRACSARADGRDWTTPDRTEPFEWTALEASVTSPVQIEVYAEGFAERTSATGRARLGTGP